MPPLCLIIMLIHSMMTLDYSNKDTIKIKVKQLDSRTTHLHFDYNYIKLCPVGKYELLDQTMAYKISMLVNSDCNQLCKLTYSQQDLEKIKWMIDHGYEIFYTLEDEPALYRQLVTPNSNISSSIKFEYDLGFPIGYKQQGVYYLQNHINLIFRYKKLAQNSIQIQNFIVQNSQVKQQNCKKNKIKLPDTKENVTQLTISFTYSITFEQSNQTIYLKADISSSQRAQWILTSIIINVFYCFIIILFLYKHLTRDIRNCTRQIFGNTIQQFVQMSQDRSSGWKQHRREVFRAPFHKALLSTLAGAGIQAIFLIFSIITLMSVYGMHYLQLESEKISGIIKFLIVTSAFLAGYASAKIFKMWGGQHWIINSVVSSLILPIVLLTGLVIDNLMRLFQNANSYSILEMVYIPIIWILISIPLSIFGSVLGYKRKGIKHPININAVPELKKYEFDTKHQIYTGFVASLIPYISFATEYRVILDSFWMKGRYDFYLFSYVSVIILIISSGLASMFTTFRSLNKGNPKWWGIPFIISSGIAFMFIIVQTIYLILEMQITRLSSIVIYFTWSFMSVCVVFLFTGASGFILNTIFVRTIYQLIKID